MIKNVKVIPWCISCKNCETVCSDIFKVSPKSKVISHDYKWKESEILQAELMCPVNVIKVEKQWWVKISFKKAKVEKKTMLNHDVLEITFKTKNFKFKPWQYISIQANDLIWKFSRSYSVASAWEDFFSLNVKLLKKWRWSKFLRNLKIKDEISFLWALWNFYLKDTKNDKVFIATGTWLAPMIAMLEELEKKDDDINKTIVFWVRNEKDLYSVEKLKSFKNTKIITKVSRPNKWYNWSIWRVTDYLSNIKEKQEIYICWNPEMVESVIEWLVDRWHDEKLIFNESFTISRVYPGFWKDIFLNWHVPAINIFSWIVIILSLTFIPFSWFYNSINNNLYWNYLWMNNFMWFMFDLSWWSVVFVMAIRPIADLFPKIWLFNKLVSLRKAFWILSSSIIVVNLVWPMILDFDKFINYFKYTKWEIYIPTISRISEITAIILLITSNHFSQKKLWIWWKRIQRSSYLYFITWWIIAWVHNPLKIYPAMIIVILLWLIAQIRISIKK